MENAPAAATASPSRFIPPPDFARGAERSPAVFVRAAARAAQTKRAGETKGPPYQGFALFAAPGGGVEVRAVVVTGVFPGFGSGGSATVEERFWQCLHSRTVGHVLPLNRVATAETLATKRLAYAATLSRPDAQPAPLERPDKMPVTTATPAAPAA